MAVYIKNAPAGMTYRQALESGYEASDIVYQLGYVSRRENPDNALCYVAEGNRKGQLFVLLTNRESTRYCYRLYLKKKGGEV